MVTAVSPSGHKITIEELEHEGLEPRTFINGFPLFDAEIPTTAARTGRVMTAHLGRNGYTVTGTPIVLGSARYRRDHSD